MYNKHIKKDMLDRETRIYLKDSLESYIQEQKQKDLMSELMPNAKLWLDSFRDCPLEEFENYWFDDYEDYGNLREELWVADKLFNFKERQEVCPKVILEALQEKYELEDIELVLAKESARLLQRNYDIIFVEVGDNNYYHALVHLKRNLGSTQKRKYISLSLTELIVLAIENNHSVLDEELLTKTAKRILGYSVSDIFFREL